MATLTGTSGADTLVGGDANDILTGQGGSDDLRGNGGVDSLFGGGGNDILNGGAGVDYMRGGGGNDRYFIFSEGEDVREDDTIEGGIDTVLAGINYTLETGFENLTLLTSTTVGADNDINGTGNAAANVLTGNVGSNVLSGKAGNDVLDGMGGNDVLIGGVGNDRYIINSAGDVAFESSDAPAGGNDTVLSTVSYSAAFGIENVTLQGPLSLNANGNGLNNVLTGNAAANAMNGLGGNDVLQGLGGADTLNGANGNDQLAGGAGVDLLTGGAGNDAFLFTNLVTSGDTITDFRNVAGNDDRFLVVAAQFGGGLQAGQLDANQFRLGAAAQDADDRFIFNDATNQLFFDRDGTGQAGLTLVANLDAGATVTVADIFLI